MGKSELGDFDLTDSFELLRRVDDWTEKKRGRAYPTFQSIGESFSQRHEVVYLDSRVAQRFDAPMKDLWPEPFEPTQVGHLFRVVNDHCSRNGFVTGFPTDTGRVRDPIASSRSLHQSEFRDSRDGEGDLDSDLKDVTTSFALARGETARAIEALGQMIDLVVNRVHLGNVKKVSVHEAKTHLSRLLARVAADEEVVISKGGRPIARLVPIQDREVNRVPGQDEGRIWIADDFDAPLPPEVQSLFQ